MTNAFRYHAHTGSYTADSAVLELCKIEDKKKWYQLSQAGKNEKNDSCTNQVSMKLVKEIHGDKWIMEVSFAFRVVPKLTPIWVEIRRRESKDVTGTFLTQLHHTQQ